jgi:valyl-tRNA synthetase
MSKSLGNSPDPLDLIEQYGADGVRVGMLFSSPAGNDLLFDESSCEQGRNFSNKIWNAFRLLKGLQVDAAVPQPASARAAVQWFAERFQQQLAEINEHYAKFRLSDALMSTYKLVWDDFCAWYLEAVKPEFTDGQAKPVDTETYTASMRYFEQLMKLLHPFMPFLTEELYHLMHERKGKDAIIVAPWPVASSIDTAIISRFEQAAEVITQLRNIRKQKNISPKESLVLHVKGQPDDVFDALILKLANVSDLNFSSQRPEGAIGFVVKANEYYVPLIGNIDVDAEKERLTKELTYNKGFLKSVQSKLANERFVANAKPEVLHIERQKEADALAKIKAIEEQLATL